MSKMNIVASVEDEFLRTALDNGWVKESQDYFKGEPDKGLDLPPTQISHSPAAIVGGAAGAAAGAAAGGAINPAAPKGQAKVYKSPLIEQVQQVLSEMNINPGKIDSIWGPATSKAWNFLSTMYKKNYGGDIGMTTGEVPPSEKNMGFVVEQLAPAVLKNMVGHKQKQQAKADDNNVKEAAMQLTPKQQEIVSKVMKAKGLDLETAIAEAQRLFPAIFAPSVPSVNAKVPGWAQDKEDYLPKGEEILKGIEEKMKGWKPGAQTQKGTDAIEVVAPKPVDTFPAAPEHIPSFKADDMKTNATFVINELVKLANDLDEMGETAAADAVDAQVKVYKEAMDKLYDTSTETGEKFLGVAHPGKSPVIAPAKDEGGLVENLIEQQEADLAVMKKTPTGKYAKLMVKLIATANKLDEEGDVEGAKIVDKTIAELKEKLLPFVVRNSAYKAAGSKEKKALGSYQDPESTVELSNLSKYIVGNMEQYVKDFDYLVGEHFQTLRNKWKPLKELFQKYIPIVDSFKGVPFENSKEYNYVVSNIEALSNELEKYHQFAYQIQKEMGRPGYFSSEIRADADLNYKSIKKLVEYYKNGVKKLFSNLIPVMEKGKEEKAPEQNTEERKVLMERYKGTLNSVISAMEKNKEQAVKAFGNPRTYGKFLDVLKIELQNINTKNNDYLEKANNLVYTKLLGHLKRWKVAGSKLNIKIAEEGLLDMLGKLPEPPAGKGKVVPGKGKVVYTRPKADSQVAALQQALNSAGFSLKVDGLWGPRTATAYNKFIDAHGGVEKYMKPVENLRAQRHTTRPANLQYATKIVNYFSKKDVETGSSAIDLGAGISVPLQTLQSPQSFVEYMRTMLGTRDFTPQAAMKYLNELSRYVSENEADMEGKKSGSVNSWKKALYNLTRAFQQYERRGGAQGDKPSDTELKDPWAKQQGGFLYPWETQKGTDAGQGQAGQGQTGQGRWQQPQQKTQPGQMNLNTPEGIIQAAFDTFDPHELENPNLFRQMATQAGKNPEVYLKEQYALLAQITNALKNNYQQIKNKGLEGKYREAMQVMLSINGSFERLADRLNLSLNAPAHEAETAPIVGKK